MQAKRLATALSLAALLPAQAWATDGYFSHGYGMMAKGRGGAAVAMTTDAFGGANNPATMVFAGGRVDLGIDWFSPDRSASRAGSNGGGALDGSAGGDRTEYFFIPEVGYNKLLRDDLSLGVSVYGNGGMNTSYAGGQLDQGMCQGHPPNGVKVNLLCGQGSLGVDLSQLIIAPTLSWKFTDNQSVGIAPLLGYQRFKAHGLDAFAAISSDPANLSGNGYDHAYGAGVRVGYYARITPSLAFGATYSTKVWMTRFHKYRGLFADHGSFDIPENFSAGFAFKATGDLTIALDYERINYSGVASVGNPSNAGGCVGNPPAGPGTGGGCLGASGASIGFGWQDVNVFKLGLEYRVNEHWTLRGGYNHSDNPIQARDVTFNILAPGVVQDHLTMGATYSLPGGSQLTMAYMHAFQNSVSGPATNPYFPVGGTETINLSENSFGLGWGMKF